MVKDRIKTYLEFKIPEAKSITIAGFERMPGGNSRETVGFEAIWRRGIRYKSQHFIFRIELPGSVVESDSEKEFRVMKALESTPVPVPEPYWLEKDEKWLGQPFFAMQRLAGNMDFDTISDPEAKSSMMKRYLEVLGHQHRLDWEDLGLSWLGVPEGSFESASLALREWKDQYDRNQVEPNPLFNKIFAWLEKNQPKKVERISLIHGDPGPGNMIIKDEQILAVHDWEMAHLGDPMDDLGWLCWREYVKGGQMDRSEILRSYEELGGIKVNDENVFYYEVFANIKAAVCCINGCRAFCDGRNPALNMAATGLGGVNLFLNLAARKIGL